MGKFRDAIETGIHSAKRLRFHYEPAASEEQIAAAEAALGMPIPEQLRRLYREFNGVWFGLNPAADTEGWIVLPTHLLRKAKDEIAGLGYAALIEGWSAEFAKCVVYTMPEHGASFCFMTDAGAWGIPPGLVGQWDHDGGEWNPDQSLEEYLQAWGTE